MTDHGNWLRRLGLSVQNALEIARLGRLTEPYAQPFEIRHTERVFRLRRYAGAPSGPPLLLVPPLMVASEIYDMSEELSAVRLLREAGVDVWICDFGAPEHEEGGMERTLDDHVRAVSRAIELVAAQRARPVHLAGYSQGGMFAYQAAAFRRSQDVASVITFGSPVDIHRNVPLRLGDELAQRVAHGVQRLLERPLEKAEGLPGVLTSTGFKLLSVRKEFGQIVDFVVKLHDRQALEKRESRRRFLGGEGFVAWPGPALRKFIEEFIVHNRMVSGGFVIDGQTVTLADITVPVLYFVGTRDDMARPASVRAIEKAVVSAEVHGVAVPAGHFGLVIGSRSREITWPTVIDWLRWREGEAPRPAVLAERSAAPVPEEAEDADWDDIDVRLFFDATWDWTRAIVRRFAQRFEDASDAASSLRVQLPRLSQLERMDADTCIGMAQVLAERARETPEETFFLWRGRAFTYGEADRRVGYVAKGLVSLGVRHGDRVAVWMGARPSYLTAVSALNRIGAAAVLLRPEAEEEELAEALALTDARALLVDPEHGQAAAALGAGPVWCLGGGGDRKLAELAVPETVVDMERIDPDAVVLPGDVAFDRGRARDLALILLTPGRGERRLRAARITNGRWAFSALGTAAAATLTSDDTVYAALPLHHAAGILVATGSALVGGARLALASEGWIRGPLADPAAFWGEVRRSGATVVYYAGEMCRPLVNAPFTPGERNHPVRLFAGSGMRPAVWRQLVDRFDVGVLEFYASTEATAVLANASGEKIGALGRPLPGTTPMELVAYDFAQKEPRRDERGLMVRCEIGEPGVLLSQVDATHPSAAVDPRYDGAADARMRRNVFAPGDLWFLSSDVLRQDEDGDFHFLGRLGDVIVRDGLPIFPRPLADVLDEMEGVALAKAFAVEGRSVVALVALPGARLDAPALRRALRDVAPARWPDEVRVLEDVVLTEGHRPERAALLGSAPLLLWRRDGEGGFARARA